MKWRHRKAEKQHPCGSSEWEILRVGADFRLKCGLRASDHDCKKACGEKYQRTAQGGGDRIGTLRSFCAFQESTCNYRENVL